ncbi:MFS transporter [Novosphingobium flavum]|uniref:MFS transporter n=1 Tax=Novosphingobium flavum TaxID=1778672 RepID=A0A7X1FUC5_9SPHN|nr:MFS transporter [Novosphingobium flavum]MBC2667159.1 MFS transporter [Novosphingobium flavum]
MNRDERPTVLDSAGSWYVLILLTTSYALAYVDRQLLNLLVDPVKRTLDISDTQFSFIQGFAFISAYIAAAPLFGRLVDVTNRRNILLGGVTVWSLCTALCGMADNFWELAIARFGVGVSEACVYPVAMSVIPELFSTRRLPRALSLFALGTQIGGGFSLLAGGAVITFAASVILLIPALSSLETWQLSFVLVGLPGLLLSAFLLSVREPPRMASATKKARPFTLRECAAKLHRSRAFYGRLYLYAACSGIVFLCIPAWYPTYLIRVFGMPAATVGWQVGAITLLFGGVGTLAGPWVAGMLTRRGYADGALRAACCAVVGSFSLCLAIPFAQTPIVALAIIGGIIFCCGLPTSLIAFSLQRVTPGAMRGMTASLYTLTVQVVGYGVGPTAVALVTEKVFGGPMMVGHSLQVVCSTAAFVGFCALITNLRHFRELLAEVESGVPAEPEAEPEAGVIRVVPAKA